MWSPAQMICIRAFKYICPKKISVIMLVDLFSQILQILILMYLFIFLLTLCFISFAGKDLHLHLDTIQTQDLMVALQHTKPSARTLTEKYAAWQKEYESLWYFGLDIMANGCFCLCIMAKILVYFWRYCTCIGQNRIAFEVNSVAGQS